MRSQSFTSSAWLKLGLAATLGLAVWQTPSPVAANENARLSFAFDYSQTSDSLFTDNVKAQLDEAARFVGSYIAAEHEVRVTVVTNVGGNALASAGPREWEENTTTKFLPTEGGLTFRRDVIEDARDNSAGIVSLTAHELMHILGFTETAKAFAEYSRTGQFVGPTVLKMNNGQSVAVSGSHFPFGTRDVTGIKPRMTDGGGDLLSVLDLAVLKDLGYSIPVLNNATTAPILGFTIWPENFVRFTLEDDDGNKLPFRLQQGYGGADTLIAGDKDYLMAGGGGDDILISGKGTAEMRGDNTPGTSYGQDGADMFVIHADSGKISIVDLDVGTDIIMLSPEFGLDGREMDKLPAMLTKKETAPGSGFFYVGTWVLKIGDFELSITTKNKQLPTAENFKIGDYSVPKM